MSRVRIVNGDINVLRSKTELDAIVPPAMTREEAARIAAAAMNQEVIGGCLSDPAGMMSDAIGRYTPIEEKHTPKAKWLVQHHAIDDGRFTIPGLPDMDIVIVLHPEPGKAHGVLGEEITVDRYMVFARERGANGEELDIPWICYTCENAAKRKHTPKEHKCWRKRPARPNMVPVMFAWAHGIDDAEDLAKELRAAWQADREQEVGEEDWSLRMEIPFSPDWQAGYLAGNPKAWTTLSTE